MRTGKKMAGCSLGFAMGAVACGLRARKPQPVATVDYSGLVTLLAMVALVCSLACSL